MAEFKRVINVIPLTRLGFSSSQIFTYSVPTELYDKMRPGQVVKIPFRSRTIFGLVSSVEMHRLKNEVKGLKSVIALLSAIPVMTEKNLVLMNWAAGYYVSPLGVMAKAMMPKPVKRSAPRSEQTYEKRDPDFVLTEAQRAALNQIVGSLGRTGEFLLSGPRGSGKTEVCLQVVKRVVGAGKQVIFLVPETSYLSSTFELLGRRFGVDNIALLHSELRDTERFWEWQKVASQDKSIILGTRSAIFAPARNLGAVIILDEHHSSYKQYDQQPKYDARRVAAELSREWQCPLVSCSATPSVGLYERCVSGPALLLVLADRIKADVHEPRHRIVAVDVKVADGQTDVMSAALRVELTQALLKKRSTLLIFTKKQAGRLTDELHELFLEEFRSDKPEVVRLSQNEILIDPSHQSAPPALLAILDADFYLRWQDFRAAERAFQYLSHLASRLGSGDKN